VKSTVNVPKKSITPAVGSPILTVTAHKRETEGNIIENINTDNSSIYFCSEQIIPVNIATSRGIKTHIHKYDILENNKAINKQLRSYNEAAAFLNTQFVVGQVMNPNLIDLNSSSGQYPIDTTPKDLSKFTVSEQNQGGDKFAIVPAGRNVYRSKQIQLVNYKGYFEKYKIKRVVRMNGDSVSDSQGIPTTAEEAMCKQVRCRISLY